jgi:hypothetical protein
VEQLRERQGQSGHRSTSVPSRFGRRGGFQQLPDVLLWHHIGHVDGVERHAEDKLRIVFEEGCCGAKGVVYSFTAGKRSGVLECVAVAV